MLQVEGGNHDIKEIGILGYCKSVTKSEYDSLTVNGDFQAKEMIVGEEKLLLYPIVTLSAVILVE